MKTLTRREMLGGLALALAAAATSNASADTAKEPISLNAEEERAHESAS